MTTAETSHDEGRTPTCIAYHVTDNGDKGRWNAIGAYFAHRDGKGGTLVLNSLPIAFDGRIVLRTPKAE